jgi:arylsulfatase A-like enzyme
MLNWKPITGLLIITGMVAVILLSCGSEMKKPNILVLVGDDAGWRDFGCYGNKTIRTPNIDRLAQSGMLAENAFLTTPQCSPSRISILTGKYPHATGAEDLHTPMPADKIIAPTYLKKSGYFTGHTRKTHYGPNAEQQFEWYSEKLDDFALFLKSCGDRPFFFWVGFTDPHRPYSSDTLGASHKPEEVEVPPHLADTPETRGDLALYYDKISRLDGDVGRFIATLEQHGRRENTLIIFLSDNGAPFPREKGTLYDAGIKTPLIFSWPAVIASGRRYKGLLSVIDLAPTFLDLAGMKTPANMHGKSLSGVLKNPAIAGRTHVFSERNWHNCDEHIRSVRTLRHKLIRNAYTELPHGSPADITGSPSWQSLRELKNQNKLAPAQSLLFQAPRPEIELYDLEKDPWELDNIAGAPENAGLVLEFTKVLDRWIEETGDFPPARRRDDNTDRITGVKFTQEIPPLRDE